MYIRRDGTITIDARSDEENGITVVDAAGVIDTGTTLILDERLSTLIREKNYKIIVNLAGVTYVSSAGWGLFISLLQKTRDHQGDIKLVNLTQEVSNVFNMLAFSNLISSYTSEEEAIEAFTEKS